MRGLPFRGAKRPQSLLVSMEMLHAQLVSEQLRYLRVPALRYAPHTAAWLSAESNRTGKTKILFSFGWLQKQISSASGPHGAPQQGHVSTCYLQQRQLWGRDEAFPPNGKIIACFWFPPMERHP